MSSITTGNEEQYSDGEKLAARGRLNQEYTIAETGWFPWVARQLPLMTEHPAHMRITEPEDVFLALTSYPPGDRADEAELAAFRAAISEAFRAGSGVLEVGKETRLFISRKAR
ncbi:hypothetical protein [Rhizobium mesosinicum]|uniref:DUF1488 domain-containing protein n=1 Tax=Rhizobium mesosinicum TaxID=335017 RepID=A0ABS7H015_9HYPH|nr:hypothetical protein [Rhizobium mesosinicum]MBW9054883.1 hypothetical protein [Rhizobium mesosinicum]